MIKYLQLHEVDSPQDIMSVVMAYAEKADESPWICWANAIAPDRRSVFLAEDGKYFGYFNGYLHMDGYFFMHCAYMKHPILNGSEVLDNICKIMADGYDYDIQEIRIESSVHPRLLNRYRFKEVSRVYTRRLKDG